MEFYGDSITEGVRALSKNPALPKSEQMGDSLRRISAQPREVAMVKLAEGPFMPTNLVDMAADGGGNCELTVAGQTIEHGGVRIVGLSNPPAQMGTHASFMFANNVLKLLALFGKGELTPDWNDEIVVGVTITSSGSVHHGPTADALGVAVTAVPATPKEVN